MQALSSESEVRMACVAAGAPVLNSVENLESDWEDVQLGEDL